MIDVISELLLLVPDRLIFLLDLCLKREDPLVQFRNLRLGVASRLQFIRAGGGAEGGFGPGQYRGTHQNGEEEAGLAKYIFHPFILRPFEEFGARKTELGKPCERSGELWEVRG